MPCSWSPVATGMSLVTGESSIPRIASGFAVNVKKSMMIYVRNVYFLDQVSISIAAVLFISSLFTVAMKFSPICSGCPDGEVFKGFEVLILGWLGVFQLTFAWFANPLLVLAMVRLHRRPWAAFFLTSAGLGLAISSLNFKVTWIDQRYASHASVDLELGFYLWVGSFAVLWCGTILKLIRNRILRSMGEDI
jgi:hypothetical protein